MKRLGLNISLLFLTLLATLSAFANGNITFETKAPLKVAVGESFSIAFELNSEPDNDSFKAPSFSGFDIIAGPAISHGSSIQIINNSMSKSINYTYTYVVVASSAGTHTIGNASVSVDKKRYTTKQLPIEVITEEQAAQQSASSHGRSTESSQGSIAKDDILLRTIVSRTSLFKGEPLRAVIKLYSRAPIVGAEDEKMPTFNGFWAQDIKNKERNVERETYNGKVYETQTLYDYLLYPQQSGELVIEPASMTIIAQQRVRSRNVDPFFGGGFDIVNIRRPISTQRVTLNVQELPIGAPASFNGAVGDFTMESELTPLSVAANSSISYTIRISGNGNLSLIQAPSITLPNSFEQYNVKSTESINTNRNGASGYKKFEYPLIARSEGDFTLQPAEFSFFNPKSMKYVTLNSRSFNLVVSPDGSGGRDSQALVQRSASREDIMLLGRDIRFIKIGNPNLGQEVQPFILSKAYFVTLFIIFALFIAIFATLRRRIKESQNSILTKGKRANKVAIQRFKAANSYLEAQNERGFYTEVLSAIWGYMSDKFNIPVANLTKESVREELHKRNVSQELIRNFSNITTICDEAQYSPMSSAQMKEVYLMALNLISRIETEIKR